MPSIIVNLQRIYCHFQWAYTVYKYSCMETRKKIWIYWNSQQHCWRTDSDWKRKKTAPKKRCPSFRCQFTSFTGQFTLREGNRSANWKDARRGVDVNAPNVMCHFVTRKTIHVSLNFMLSEKIHLFVINLT